MFTTLPAEIFEAIVDAIPCSRDIFTLRLVCRQFAVALEPKLDYIYISAPSQHHSLWSHLAMHPHFARHVRTLRIVAENRLPRGFSPFDSRRVNTRLPVDLETTTFCQALRWMIDLRALQWGCDDTVPHFLGDGIWTTLRRSCPRLSELGVVDFRAGDFNTLDAVGDGSASHTWIYKSKIFDLSNLTQFSMVSGVMEILEEQEDGLDTEPLTRFLLRCPNLEILAVFFQSMGWSSPPSFDNIFTNANWSRLKVLSFNNITCSSSVFSAFVRRHPSIETLHGVDNLFLPIPWASIEHDSLPNLREFRGPLAGIKAVGASNAPVEVTA
ncbi:hypothetical protein JAAARDRAFT_390677 [Jaapia argillacea MUCL 33604]|uniref:F-box domain-containing protein n=1 Tax=Jaapia argillacea MUCL 33604 TaxID=933084 RepID=A0A067Q9N8_9AGAM|nr:hypothetical protein JAAARDRAFT_390677 [Jaapia argillacea MUCL 33604]